jgi:hypothetical protein
MIMTKATKRKTAPGNDDLASARSLVKRRLEEALVEREADIKVLRQLISQINESSPYLLQKFASEASRHYSRLAEEFIASGFGHFDAEGKLAPFYGNDDHVIRLDAFLAYHLTEEALRRRRDASRHEFETY